jgi:hypothetical protein
MKINFKKNCFSSKNYVKRHGVVLLSSSLDEWYIVEQLLDEISIYFSSEEHMRKFRDILDAKYASYSVEY